MTDEDREVTAVTRDYRRPLRAVVFDRWHKDCRCRCRRWYARGRCGKCWCGR